MQYKAGANGCSFTVRPVSISDNRGVPHNQSKSQNRVNLTPTWQVAAVLKGKNFNFRELVFFVKDNLRGGMVVASPKYSRIMVILIPRVIQAILLLRASHSERIRSHLHHPFKPRRACPLVNSLVGECFKSKEIHNNNFYVEICFSVCRSSCI